MDGTIYLLHFDRPLAHAKHYLGWTEHLEERLDCHRRGDGARIMAVLAEQGIGWRLVRTWKGDRNLERRLKNRKETPQLCPCCNPRAERLAH